jgi:DNA-binding NarL/FixJ family response regulator
VARLIRIVVVDDHPVVAAGMLVAIAGSADIEIAGVAKTMSEAESVVASVCPDVILCDIQLGSERALDLPRRLGSSAPPLIFFTSFDYPSYVREALAQGAAGYILKSAPLAEIDAAIRSVAAGGTAYSARHLRIARNAPRMPSGRELQVVGLVGLGTSNAEIGLALKIDERTVESHLRRLFDRYAVNSRTELVTYCVHEGWIDLAAGDADAAPGEAH